jgi:hypothetical protein
LLLSHRQHDINRDKAEHAFPIDLAQSTRLPPWEDFQRGPQSVHAETLHHGPHRKSFTILTNAARRFNVCFANAFDAQSG